MEIRDAILMKNDISYFTTSKQIAYELSVEAREELERYEQAHAYLVAGVPLKTNLLRLPKVLDVQFGREGSGLIQVEFEARDGDDDALYEDVGDVIVSYAFDARSIAELVPDPYGPRPLTEPLDRSVAWEDRLRRLVHVERDFVVTHVRHGDSAEIHFLLDGTRSSLEVELTPEMREAFAEVMADDRSAAAADAILPTRDLGHVREWAHTQANIPDLERRLGLGPSLADHRLADVVHPREVAYFDEDVIITKGRSLTAHFEDDGAYRVRLFSGEERRQILELLDTPGLDPRNTANPLRRWLDERLSSDFDRSNVIAMVR